MAEETHVVHGFNWRQAFPFTHIFRAFRIAIHPSKMVLALAFLGLIYGGGRLLELFWRKGNRPFEPFLRDQVEYLNAIVTFTLAGNFFYPAGVIGAVIAFCASIADYFARYPAFFAIFYLYFAFLWSVFGGAIARIAAVHVARDEKISVRASVKFSVSKILSFFFAPVIPLLIVILLGLSMSVVSIIGNIPWVGMPVLGAFFFLMLIGGFLMTLVLVGTVGGFNLMYPTIAVEGSDSFDAISRSFSYLYARPWRLSFYTLVAIVYGALTYYFLKLFILIILSLTHYFVDVGIWTQAKSAPAPSSPAAPMSMTDALPIRPAPRELWNQVWPAPSVDDMRIRPNYSALNGGDRVGAGLVFFWVYLTLSILGAYLISYYFSVNTIIYYLMRQEVDATALDDVFVEQSEDDFVETPTSPAPVTPAPDALATPDAPPAQPISPLEQAPPIVDKPSDPI